jgi:hypothetical protein
MTMQPLLNSNSDSGIAVSAAMPGSGGSAPFGPFNPDGVLGAGAGAATYATEVVAAALTEGAFNPLSALPVVVVAAIVEALCEISDLFGGHPYRSISIHAV